MQTQFQEQALWRRRWLRVTAGAVAVAVAAGTLVACSSRLAPASSQGPGGSPTEQAATASTTPAPVATVSPGSSDAASAVRAVIDKANGEQAQALAQHDPTLMRDTATAACYSEMVQTQQQMEQSGVTAIKLLNTEWGPVSIQGTTAQATTTETWQVSAADGSSQQSTDRNLYTLVQQGGQWLIARDAGVGSSSVGQPGSSGGTGQSTNWAGYAATGGPFTAVTGTWTVPKVGSSSTAGAADAAWVGIGGVNSNDLIQAGTDATVTGQGRVEYTAWVEMLPRASQPVPLTVSPGDVVRVSITQQTAGAWQISIADQTTNKSYQTTVQYSSSMSSAEWIEEAPSTASGRSRVVTLDDFGQIQFRDATAMLGGQQVTVGAAGAQPITMYDRSGSIATTSALGSDGSSFTVTRVSAGV